MNFKQLEAAVDDAIAKDLDETLKRLLRQHFDVKTSTIVPFGVEVELVNITGAAAAQLEGDRGINLANSISRALRRIAYNTKLALGYSGIKIVAEGDSWFEYPVILKDVIDHLSDTYAVYSLAGGGHLLTDMASEAEYMPILAQENPEFFLLSGGGNDMLQNGNLKQFLKKYTAGMTAAQVFDDLALKLFLDKMLKNVEKIITDVNQKFPNIIMLMHGYDYALPQPGGAWLGKPLKAAGVPQNMWKDVVRLLIDIYNTRLKTFETRFPGRFYHVDCRGVVGDGVQHWKDELHPKDAGYGRAAAQFIKRIQASEFTDGGGSDFSESFPVPVRAIVSPLQSVGIPEQARQFMRITASLKTTARMNSIASEVDPSTEAIIGVRPEVRPPELVEEVVETPELLDWRRQLAKDPENRRSYDVYLKINNKASENAGKKLAERLELTSSTDRFALERIVGVSNLYQSNFFECGVRASRAVGKITVISPAGTPRGMGTGFLIAPGLLITNHHVLDEANFAKNSFVAFDYEYDADHRLKPTIQFAFTSEVFYTNAEYDFTIISVAPTSSTYQLKQFGYLPLIEKARASVRGESISIVQHPGGSTKQLALRDSKVIGRDTERDQFVYYTTDTNPGSSGAPVLNDDWLVVALHHRSVPNFDKPYEFVANRGIRSSSIMEHLAQRGKSDPRVRALYQRLSQVTSTDASSISTSDVSSADGGSASEAMRQPFRVPFTVARPGYDPAFLGLSVPLPKLRAEYAHLAAPLLDGPGIELKYEHFSIVMHKTRRLALFAASNVDASPQVKRPDASRPKEDYNRIVLSGLGKNDIEQWFEDERVDSAHQLPDRFFTRDGGAFDKGHIVRRDDVAWGETYDQLRRANGDTYHTTNCSPQVAKYNQSSKKGEWGQLENDVLSQAVTEKISIFAGPVLDPSDRLFHGKDGIGEVRVQIPAKFWKLIVARSGNQLQSFAYVLEQDLSDVPLEFDLGTEWKHRMVSIAALEGLVRYFRFPKIIRDSDQYEES